MFWDVSLFDWFEIKMEFSKVVFVLIKNGRELEKKSRLTLSPTDLDTISISKITATSNMKTKEVLNNRQLKAIIYMRDSKFITNIEFLSVQPTTGRHWIFIYLKVILIFFGWPTPKTTGWTYYWKREKMCSFSK